MFSRLVILKETTRNTLGENGERFPITLTFLDNIVCINTSSLFARLRYFAWILVKSLTRSEFFVTDAFFGAPPCIPRICTRLIVPNIWWRGIPSSAVTEWFLSSVFVRCLLAWLDTATRRVERNTGMPIYHMSFHFCGARDDATDDNQL